jgi:hypothetical protein
MGLGMMGPAEIKEEKEEEVQRLKDDKKREAGLAEGRGENVERNPPENELESGERSASPAGSSSRSASATDLRNASGSPRRGSKSSTKPPAKPPAIFIHARPTGRRRDSIRRKVLTPSAKDTSRSHPGDEEGDLNESEEDITEEEAGRASASEGLPAPTAVRGRPSGASTNASVSTSTSSTNLLQTRSPSPSRTGPAIRFADETAPSSDTVPSGQKAYGNRSPSGGNSSLAMYRTSSVQSNASQKSEKSESESRGLKFLLPGRR